MVDLIQNYDKNISSEYDRILNSTFDIWGSHPGIGLNKELPDGYTKFGISLGSFFKPTEELKPLFAAIGDLADLDPRHVILPSGSYHFTFLALAGHTLNENQPLPPEITSLKQICWQMIADEKWTLENLRLLPGPNFLLLVGKPSAKVAELREKFAKALLQSPWGPLIHLRHEYRGYPFPPVIWHTTLCRYKAEYLPERTRTLVRKYCNQRFGSIDLDPPLLRRVNYDWSRTVLIS